RGEGGGAVPRAGAARRPHGRIPVCNQLFPNPGYFGDHALRGAVAVASSGAGFLPKALAGLAVVAAAGAGTYWYAVAERHRPQAPAAATPPIAVAVATVATGTAADR